MLRNVKAEMVRKGLLLEDLSNLLKELGFTLTQSTLSQKLNGKSRVTVDEAKAIKKVLGSDEPLEILFSTDEDEV